MCLYVITTITTKRPDNSLYNYIHILGIIKLYTVKGVDTV